MTRTISKNGKEKPAIVEPGSKGRTIDGVLLGVGVCRKN